MKTLMNKESFGTLGKEFHEGIIDYFTKKVDDMKPEIIQQELITDLL
jgi:hypothetical protein